MPTLHFAGRDWHIKTGFGGPGPCYWSADNAWVDDDGHLHLKITRDGDTWRCAEVFSLKNYRFGTFQWWVTGALESLDVNVVLGLFPYLGPEGMNEIDIEMARFGQPDNDLGNFTVWPATADGEITRTFPVHPRGADTTHRLGWQSDSVHFQLLNGHRGDDEDAIHTWIYQPRADEPAIPRIAMPLHMNLWLFRGLPPVNGQGVEIVIAAFDYRQP